MSVADRFQAPTKQLLVATIVLAVGTLSHSRMIGYTVEAAARGERLRFKAKKSDVRIS
jgi:hypothetical protein